MREAARFHRLADLFARARTLARADREALLASECAGDKELCAQLERMLQRHDRASDDDSSSMRELLDQAFESPSVEVPERIGPHRVVRRIATGGMGTVYEAVQEDPHRHVAIKVLREDMFSDDMLARFRREAEILTRLQHPGIARIHTVGVTEPGRPYIVMELIEGVAITEFARGLEETARAELLAQVGDAIDHAHRNGVIHRDLKPANVLVTAAGRSKILDFGVARSLGRDTMQTATGHVIGTLRYMSPEQARGEPVDLRSDIYALGVIAWEVLTGTHPFEGSSTAEVLSALVSGEAPSPVLRGDLGLIVATAMAPEAERRYASAATLRDDLKRYLASEAILARPATATYQLKKFVARHKVYVGAALAAVVALAVGLVVALKQRADAVGAAARAEVYSAAIALFDANPVGASRRAERVPEAHRHWEWRWLAAALDQSVQRVPRSSEWFVVGDGGRLRPSAAIETTAGGPIAFHTLSGSPIHLIEERTGRVVFAQGVHADSWRPAPGVSVVRPGRNELVVRIGQKEVRCVHRDLVKSVAINAKRDRVSTTSRDPRVLVWSVDDGRIVAELSGHRSGVVAVAFDHAGDRIASVSYDGTVRIWDLSSGQTERVFGAPVGSYLLGFSSDDRTLYCAAADEVVAWAVAGGLGCDILRVHDGPAEGNRNPYVYAVGFSGDQIVSAGWDGTVRVTKRRGRKPVRTIRTRYPNVYGARVLRGRRVVVLSGGGTDGDDHALQVFDLGDGSPALEVLLSEQVCRLAISPDQSRAAIASARNGLCVVDLATMQKREWHSKDRSYFDTPAVCFTPDGEQLLYAGADGRVRVFDRALRPVRAFDVSIQLHSIAHHPDRSLVATGDSAGVIHLLDPRTGEVLGALTGHSSDVYALAFHPDGTRLASGSRDNRICLWDFDAREEVLQLRGHEAYVFDLAWSADGETLASASGDNTVRLWATTTMARRWRASR